MGARAYRVAKLFDFAPGECVVEIGSERGEGSTAWLAKLCAIRQVAFHTVDIDPDAYERASRIVERHNGGFCHAHWQTGEQFLGDNPDLRIRFAYLDSFDCIPAGLENERFIEYHRARYEELGLEMTNENSQAAHLEQARLVEERAASRCAVLIDDTKLVNGGWDGKGALAIPYLKTQGFVIRDLGEAQLAERIS